jgi:hypothetical protein
VAQAYIAEISDGRTGEKLGIIGAAFRAGFSSSAATGGLLSRWGFNLPLHRAPSHSPPLLIYFLCPSRLP